MIEETRLEDAYLELEGGIEGASRMGVLLLNQDEYGSVKLSPRTHYDLLEFLYQRRFALYRATQLSLGKETAPDWIQSGYRATRIIDAEQTEDEKGYGGMPMNEMYDLLELLAWQKVWDWASKTTLAPFLLSQTPLREQIEQEGITDALGATTWHSQLGGAMNTYAHPFRCYLNEVDPPHAGYELWGIDNQGAHREIWDNDEPWVEPQSMTYPYAIPAWVQEAIIRVNLLRTTWVTQALFLAVLQMCNPAEHDFQPLVDLELEGNDQALPIEAPPRIYAALADLIAGIEQAGEDTADTDRWWYVTVRNPDAAEATRRIAALGYRVVEDD